MKKVTYDLTSKPGTVIAPGGASYGDYGYVNGISYYVTDNEHIQSDVLENPIIGGTEVNGFAHLCTSKVTNMEHLFSCQIRKLYIVDASGNPNIRINDWDIYSDKFKNINWEK